MINRRHVVLGGVAAMAAGCGSVAARGEAGLPGASSMGPSVSQAELERVTRRALTDALGDSETAAKVDPTLLDVGFQWMAPTVAVGRIRTIVAYSFGNRLAVAGAARQRPTPGPVNEALADTVARLRKASGAERVFAQWEIAEVLRARYPEIKVDSVEPVVDADGKETYLSTDGVAEEVVRRGGGVLGVVGVVGHRDHAKRCVLVSRGRGMEAYAASGVELPVVYDASSGQAWTRRRELYLLHDMAAQMMMARGAAVARMYPEG